MIPVSSHYFRLIPVSCSSKACTYVDLVSFEYQGMDGRSIVVVTVFCLAHSSLLEEARGILKQLVLPGTFLSSRRGKSHIETGCRLPGISMISRETDQSDSKDAEVWETETSKSSLDYHKTTATSVWTSLRGVLKPLGSSEWLAVLLFQGTANCLSGQSDVTDVREESTFSVYLTYSETAHESIASGELILGDKKTTKKHDESHGREWK
jgi:hypothetical protein